MTNNEQVHENLREWVCAVQNAKAERQDGAGASLESKIRSRLK